MKTEEIDILVIGAGQSGLTAAYNLKRNKLNFLLVDRCKKISDSWRDRYDSLILLTTRKEDSLPGLSIQGSLDGYPTKDEYANYLESYQRQFSFPIRFQTNVERLSKGKNFIAESDDGVIYSKKVIVATGPFQKSYFPSDYLKLKGKIFQLHSSEYKNPRQIPKGQVLVVGAGDSGIQIAVELSKNHNVTLATKRKLVFDNKYDALYSFFSKVFNEDILRRLVNLLKVKKAQSPQLKDLLIKEAIQLRPALDNISNGKFYFKDGSSGEYNSVIWASGFIFDYSWIKIPQVFDAKGNIVHRKGVSIVDGLYFIYPEKDYGFIRNLPKRVEDLMKVISKEQNEK